MKRTLAMVTAVLMASASAPAFAGNAMKNNSANAKTGAQTEFNAEADAGLDSGTDAEVGIDTGTTASTANANFGSVISAIRSGEPDTADIELLEDASNVEIVRVDSLAGAADDPQALDNALDDNQEQVEELRTALAAELESNAELQAEFEQEAVTAEDVVAAETGADGSMTIYVR